MRMQSWWSLLMRHLWRFEDGELSVAPQQNVGGAVGPGTRRDRELGETACLMARATARCAGLDQSMRNAVAIDSAANLLRSPQAVLHHRQEVSRGGSTMRHPSPLPGRK